MAGGTVRSGPELGLLEVAEAESPGLIVAAASGHGRHRNHRRETTDGNLAMGRERQRPRGFVGAREGAISEREDEDEEENEVGVSLLASAALVVRRARLVGCVLEVEVQPAVT